jgi:hypothetical protein
MMTPVAGGAAGPRFSRIRVTQAMSLRMTDIFEPARNAHVTVL